MKTPPPPKTLQGQYAGFVSRFLAYFVDVLVIIATITILGITVDIILRFFQLDELIDTLMISDTLLGDALRITTFLFSVAFVSSTYFILIWTITAGQSIGKVLIGVRIVPLDGTKITFWRSIIRYFAFLLSAAVLFLGLLWVLVSDQRQGWHDKIARTCVIYDWPARETDGVLGTIQSRLKYLRKTRPRILRRKSNDETEEEVEIEEEAVESTQG